MVDPQVGRNLLVGRRAMRPLPLDQPRRSTPQAVVGPGERGAIVVSGTEDLLVGAVGERFIESVVDGIVDVDDEPGTGRQRPFDVAETEQSEPGEDLGDLGAGVGHAQPPSANSRVNCSCAPIMSAGRSSFV